MIKISDFDYALPQERIALHPLECRDACRLLLRCPDGTIFHRRFAELPGLLPVGSMLVCNETKVINARLLFHKPTGARIEIFLLEPVEPADYALMFSSRGKAVWHCLVGNLKKWKEPEISMVIPIEGEGEVRLTARRLPEESREGEKIEFTWTPAEVSFAALVEAAGNIPIPPYLNRESEESDLTDYQTVYARNEGSVAAPTAGLHFTPRLFDDLKAHNIPTAKLTLHVGAGTFKPVKTENIADHTMHTEVFSVSRRLVESLISRKKEGKPVIAVGTTCVRTLESLPLLGRNIREKELSLHVTQWEAYDEDRNFDTVEGLESLLDYMKENNLEDITASTAIMISPGFTWRITDGMVTNFHQPRSTLLLLVSSFLERKGPKNSEANPEWRKVYDSALAEDYRFLSYGDACLFL